jgi:hypothetical protein
MGFKIEGTGSDAFYWLKVGSKQRVCVAFDVPNQCLGGRTGWVWQIAKLTENPAFGYSGSTCVGPTGGRSDKVISVTLEKIYYAGFYAGLLCERAKLVNLKAELTNVLNKLP